MLIAVGLAAVVILFIYQPVEVEGTSMMPLLEDHEKLFINKYLYRFGFGDVERGDLIVFWFPENRAESYIKRVIGLPGDTVEIEEGLVRVNGAVLEEPYVPAQYRDEVSLPTVQVPPDHFFVMGDHRRSSNDSRTWGLLPRGSIYGKAVFIYWPLEKMGPVR